MNSGLSSVRECMRRGGRKKQPDAQAKLLAKATWAVGPRAIECDSERFEARKQYHTLQVALNGFTRYHKKPDAEHVQQVQTLLHNLREKLDTAAVTLGRFTRGQAEVADAETEIQNAEENQENLQAEMTKLGKSMLRDVAKLGELQQALGQQSQAFSSAGNRALGVAKAFLSGDPDTEMEEGDEQPDGASRNGKVEQEPGEAGKGEETPVRQDPGEVGKGEETPLGQEPGEVGKGGETPVRQEPGELGKGEETPVGQEPGEVGKGGETPVKEFTAFTVRELKALCTQRGLRRSGSKQELLERVATVDQFTSEPANQPANQPASQPTSQSANKLVSQSAN